MPVTPRGNFNYARKNSRLAKKRVKKIKGMTVPSDTLCQVISWKSRPSLTSRGRCYRCEVTATMRARLITRSAGYAAASRLNLFRITLLALISKCPAIPGESSTAPSQWNRTATPSFTIDGVKREVPSNVSLKLWSR